MKKQSLLLGLLAAFGALLLWSTLWQPSSLDRAMMKSTRSPKNCMPGL